MEKVWFRARIPYKLREKVDKIRAEDHRGKKEKPGVFDFMISIVNDAILGTQSDLIDVEPQSLDGLVYSRIEYPEADYNALKNYRDLNNGPSLERSFLLLLEAGLNRMY